MGTRDNIPNCKKQEVTPIQGSTRAAGRNQVTPVKNNNIEEIWYRSLGLKENQDRSHI